MCVCGCIFLSRLLVHPATHLCFAKLKDFGIVCIHLFNMAVPFCNEKAHFKLKENDCGKHKVFSFVVFFFCFHSSFLL